jgi:nucleoside-diphosphate-sugar epimerase
MRILVTGAAGFIGSHLAERLTAQGHDVRGVDCFTDHYDPAVKRRRAALLQRQGVEMLPLDLSTDELRPPLEGAEVVYHLAAQPGLAANASRAVFLRHNVLAVQRLLEAVDRASCVRGVIYTSSSSVYGARATGDENKTPRPISLYGETKLHAERMIRVSARHADWSACILRLFSVYGPHERPGKLFHKLIRCALKLDAFPLYEGSEHHQRSFTYVADVVAGLLAALERFGRCAGETMNLGYPIAHSTMQGISTVARLLGRPVCIRREPPREGDQQVTRAIIDKADRLLGVQPQTSLNTGLATEIAWMKRHVASVHIPSSPQRLIRG